MTLILPTLLLAGLTPMSSCPHDSVLPLRERAELRDQWLLARLDRVVPMLMRREQIDMWVIVAREYNEDPLNDHTAWSIELNARVTVPEWNDQSIRIMLEEDAYFDGGEVTYIDGRQEKFHLIPSTDG